MLYAKGEVAQFVLHGYIYGYNDVSHHKVTVYYPMPDGANDLKDEQVVRILLRLKPSMKKLVVIKSLLPHLRKWHVLMESEEEHLKSTIYEPSEQVCKYWLTGKWLRFVGWPLVRGVRNIC